MSFYRSILAVFAAAALATPVFADDAANAQNPADNANAPAAQQIADNSSIQQSTDQQTTSDAKVNLNKATTKELMKVKGLNASKARAIVAYRKKNGDFKSVDELTNVKGFKKLNPDSMKEIQDQVTVE